MKTFDLGGQQVQGLGSGDQHVGFPPKPHLNPPEPTFFGRVPRTYLFFCRVPINPILGLYNQNLQRSGFC